MSPELRSAPCRLSTGINAISSAHGRIRTDAAPRGKATHGSGTRMTTLEVVIDSGCSPRAGFSHGDISLGAWPPRRDSRRRSRPMSARGRQCGGRVQRLSDPEPRPACAREALACAMPGCDFLVDRELPLRVDRRAGIRFTRHYQTARCSAPRGACDGNLLRR